MQKCFYFEVHTGFRSEKMKGRYHQVYLDTYMLWGLTLADLTKMDWENVDRIKVVHGRSPNKLS